MHGRGVRAAKSAGTRSSPAIRKRSTEVCTASVFAQDSVLAPSDSVLARRFVRRALPVRYSAPSQQEHQVCPSSRCPMLNSTSAFFSPAQSSSAARRLAMRFTAAGSTSDRFRRRTHARSRRESRPREDFDSSRTNQNGAILSAVVIRRTVGSRRGPAQLLPPPRSAPPLPHSPHTHHMPHPPSAYPQMVNQQ